VVSGYRYCGDGGDGGGDVAVSAVVAGSGRPRRVMAGRLLARLPPRLRLMISSEVLQSMFAGPRLRPGCYVYWAVARRSPHWREKRVSVGRRRRMSKERTGVAKTCRCVKRLAQQEDRAIGAGRESPAGGGAKGSSGVGGRDERFPQSASDRRWGVVNAAFAGLGRRFVFLFVVLCTVWRNGLGVRLGREGDE